MMDTEGILSKHAKANRIAVAKAEINEQIKTDLISPK